MLERKEGSRSIDTYIGELRKLYDKVLKETYRKSVRETRILFEILNNWIDASILFKEYKLEEVIHNISGIVFIYLWRAGNWILYEILTGHYFEAFRDIRFLFEGSLLAVHYNYFIDKKIYEKWGSLAKLSLKAEIVELLEKMREEVRQLYKEKKLEDIKSLVRKKVEKFIADLNLAEDKKKKYVELYYEILMQPELYWSVGKIIHEYSKIWNLDKKNESSLKATWGKLSLYTHFSREFFNLTLNRPQEIWIEHYNKNLLKKCCKLYITTVDLFISTLAVAYPKLKDSLRNIVKWWEENLDIELSISKTILEKVICKNVFA